ncbi:FkbM family methyltransferase [Rhodoplanes sp. TEM]|uniref:FkbM family methyltransferase n=1 Tax=Rhodoplanes tepidamans TaxID=200616 RepID=A0ABT5J8N1_RHOTP|nr:MULTISPECIES: FkbM family methyltransferase [Rhodoplanes]MDC7786016.1 FkbM family methyltransferase [Rhodoplanes tepidamans]MDC7983843.1 FkbM family methyltransferase [Rhodoplanes sp. TEM]MDQ0359148.1 FkbM family methyltransferase [Rhodoplanes tepidamans]
MLQRLRTLTGVLASLRTYHGRRGHRDGLDRLYSGFVSTGDLVFDIGAHVGDRVAAFRRLGARVVAVEPQPQLVTVLEVLYGRDRAVAIEPVVIGRTEGFAELLINTRNPTISTASKDFVAAAAGAPGWSQERWTERRTVAMTTLDALIARHGVPAFVKIDVEGFEAEVLLGLSQSVAALSFEFTTIQRDVALAALERCAALGYARFRASLGESHAFVHAGDQDAAAMREWILGLPHEANSGDVYAVR